MSLELKELEAKYKILGEEIEKLKEKPKRWKPSLGEIYYVFTGYSLVWRDDNEDNILFSTGNVFKTHKEANRKLDLITLETELRDFADFKIPEMTKVRPVVVLSPRVQGVSRNTLVVAALSSKEPPVAQSYHMKLRLGGEELPPSLQRECWLKGDMVYSFALRRFRFYQYKRNRESGKRMYYQERINTQDLIAVRKAVASAAGLYID